MQIANMTRELGSINTVQRKCGKIYDILYRVTPFHIYRYRVMSFCIKWVNKLLNGI